MRVLVLFFLLLLLPHAAFAEVYISEIAWMGTSESANYEWIELYSTETTPLDGWSLSAVDGTPDISLSGIINGAFLLERNESALSSVADILYSGALENGGEILVLTNAGGTEVDRVDGSSSWSSVGGDNTSKETAQKANGSWKTAAPTPGEVEITSNEVAVEQSVSAYVKPEMVLNVPDSIRVVVGAETAFYTEVKNTENVRFDSAVVTWNFGDGTRIQGNNIYHVYEYPGIYVVKVIAQYGRDEVSKKITVTAYESNISFSYIDSNVVAIENGDEEELDISRWKVRDGANEFQFPEDTYVMAGEVLMLSSKVTGFFFSENVELLYSNGEKVTKVEKIAPEVVYVPVQKEEKVEEVKEEVNIQPAAAVIADTQSNTISIWVYSWIVLVLLVGGSIVYIRRYG